MSLHTVIGSIFVPRICCDHVTLAGAGWLSCPCGARCRRDERGVIVEYAFGEEPRYPDAFEPRTRRREARA